MKVKKISDYKNVDILGLGKELLERSYNFKLNPVPREGKYHAKFEKRDNKNRVEIIIDIKWDRLKEDAASDTGEQLIYFYVTYKPKKIILLNFEFLDEKAVQLINDALDQKEIKDKFELEILDIQWVNTQLNLYPDLRKIWFKDPVESNKESEEKLTEDANMEIGIKEEPEYTYSNVTIDSESEKPFLKVTEIARIFANIIIGSTNKTTHTSQEDRFYGLFGKWGRGKTFMWKKLKEIFEANNYKTVEFHAWKYQDTPAIWGYLYETIALNYYFKPKYVILTPLTTLINSFLSLWLSVFRNFNQFLLFIIGVAGIFFGYSVGKDINIEITPFDDIFTFVIPPALLTLYTGLNTLTKPIVSKTKDYIKTFGKKVDYSKHLGLQHEIQCELKCLLKAWNKPLVLFIDDIDRCKEEKIIDIVDSIRIMLNDTDIQKYLIVIAAIDHSILKSAIRNKYKNAIEASVLEFRIAEYFDKLFLIGLKLEELESYQIKEIFEGITNPYIEELEINEFKGETNNFETKAKEQTKNISPGDTTTTASDVGIIGQNDPMKQPGIENTNTKKLKAKIIETQITPTEQEFLRNNIINLRRATPRSIRNFFIKYRIARNLTYFLQYENNSDDSEWVKDDNAKKILAENLIKIMNQESEFAYFGALSPDLSDAMKRAIEMVNYYN